MHRAGVPAILVAFVCVVVGVGSPPRVNAQALELTIQFDEPSFDLGEPIIAYVTLTNNDQVSLRVPRRLEPEYGQIIYTVVSAGEERAFVPWALKENERTHEEIPPGGEVVGLSKIFFGANGWTFRNPGTYVVEVSYRNEFKGSAELRIDDPATEEERATAQMVLTDDDVGYFFLFEGGDHLKSAIETLEHIRNEFPESELAAYANFTLGKNLSSGFRGFGDQPTRPPDRDLASKYLQASLDVLDDRASLYYRVEAYSQLASVYTAMGLEQQADEAQSRLVEGLAGEFVKLRNRDKFVDALIR